MATSTEPDREGADQSTQPDAAHLGVLDLAY